MNDDFEYRRDNGYAADGSYGLFDTIQLIQSTIPGYLDCPVYEDSNLENKLSYLAA